MLPPIIVHSPKSIIFYAKPCILYVPLTTTTTGSLYLLPLHPRCGLNSCWPTWHNAKRAAWEQFWNRAAISEQQDWWSNDTRCLSKSLWTVAHSNPRDSWIVCIEQYSVVHGRIRPYKTLSATQISLPCPSNHPAGYAIMSRCAREIRFRNEPCINARVFRRCTHVIRGKKKKKNENQWKFVLGIKNTRVSVWRICHVRIIKFYLCYFKNCFEQNLFRFENDFVVVILFFGGGDEWKYWEYMKINIAFFSNFFL